MKLSEMTISSFGIQHCMPMIVSSPGAYTLPYPIDYPEFPDDLNDQSSNCISTMLLSSSKFEQIDGNDTGDLVPVNSYKYVSHSKACTNNRAEPTLFIGVGSGGLEIIEKSRARFKEEFGNDEMPVISRVNFYIPIKNLRTSKLRSVIRFDITEYLDTFKFFERGRGNDAASELYMRYISLDIFNFQIPYVYVYVRHFVEDYVKFGLHTNSATRYGISDHIEFDISRQSLVESNCTSSLFIDTLINLIYWTWDVIDLRSNHLLEHKDHILVETFDDNYSVDHWLSSATIYTIHDACGAGKTNLIKQHVEMLFDYDSNLCDEHCFGYVDDYRIPALSRFILFEMNSIKRKCSEAEFNVSRNKLESYISLLFLNGFAELGSKVNARNFNSFGGTCSIDIDDYGKANLAMIVNENKEREIVEESIYQLREIIQCFSEQSDLFDDTTDNHLGICCLGNNLISIEDKSSLFNEIFISRDRVGKLNRLFISNVIFNMLEQKQFQFNLIDGFTYSKTSDCGCTYTNCNLTYRNGKNHLNRTLH